jgi:hypothetical protein
VIARIIGEGQFEIPDSELGRLNSLDDAVELAVERGAEAEFRAALAALVEAVRAAGVPVADEELRPSTFVLPPPDAELAEVRAMLGDEGLVPG